ncbi:hypothetical protein ATY76_25605 [Rhizobium sp. R339]|nr:hypothetical protein ATY76_25605 [Rhizobium sp. R339]
MGAGASDEFGMPIGSTLTDQIRGSSRLRFDNYPDRDEGPKSITTYIRKHYDFYSEEDLKAARELIAAFGRINHGILSAESIDEYIYRYSDDALVAEAGKLQIAHLISVAESNSLLARERDFHLEKGFYTLNNTWIWAFAKSLVMGVKASEVKWIGSGVTIVCFNYDRCIEHYLEHFLMRTYHGLGQEEARSIVSNINIIHPYGTLGDLDQFPFGETENLLENMAKNLITWSETGDDEEELEERRVEIRKAIRSARQIVFLGFAFAPQNMKILNTEPREVNFNGPAVYSTGYGIEREVEESYRDKIIACYSKVSSDEPVATRERVRFQLGAKCKEFFSTNRANLVQ